MKTHPWKWAFYLGMLSFISPLTNAMATVIASSAITLSDLGIVASGHSITFLGTPDTQVFTNAFNSLGQSASNGNFGSGSDVSANATVTFAEGQAAARPSAGILMAMSVVNLTASDNFAGVSSPGSLANLSGLFGISGMAGMVNVTFSMGVSGSLHGFTDAFGMLATDADASLEIDGTPLLFDFFALTGGPNFADTTQSFTETLTASMTLDASQPHFFFWNAHTDTTGHRLPEPSSLSLILSGFALLLLWRAGGRSRYKQQ